MVRPRAVAAPAARDAGRESLGTRRVTSLLSRPVRPGAAVRPRTVHGPARAPRRTGRNKEWTPHRQSIGTAAACLERSRRPTAAAAGVPAERACCNSAHPAAYAARRDRVVLEATAGLMGRRIRWLGVIMVACLGLVVAQLVNIQLVKGKQLQTSSYNPRVSILRSENLRGSIYAADGTVLAKSVPTPEADRATYPYSYVRQYPQGALYGGITGYWGSEYQGTGIEQEYDSDLSAHREAPQTLSQLLFRQTMPIITDNVTLTVEPSLQQTAWNALTSTPGNNDGAVVVLDPKTGAVLAMVSNPDYDPNALVGPSIKGGPARLLQLRPKGPRGLLPAPAARHAGVLLPRVDDEGGDVHRRLQPQALPGGVRLSGPALPGLLRFEQAPVQRRVQPEQLQAVRRHDDVHASAVVRPRLRGAGNPRGRLDAPPTGAAVRFQFRAGHRPARCHSHRSCCRFPRLPRPTRPTPRSARSS